MREKWDRTLPVRRMLRGRRALWHRHQQWRVWYPSHRRRYRYGCSLMGQGGRHRGLGSAQEAAGSWVGVTDVARVYHRH